MIMNITFDPKCNQFEGMQRAPDGQLFRKDVAPGAACWVDGRNPEGLVKNVALRFACPCGCGTIGCLPIPPFHEGGWTWDGNVEQPTMSPSVQMLSPCRWHGYLKKGVWEKA